MGYPMDGLKNPTGPDHQLWTIEIMKTAIHVQQIQLSERL